MTYTDIRRPTEEECIDMWIRSGNAKEYEEMYDKAMNQIIAEDRIDVDFSITGTYHAHANGETTLFNWDKSQAYIVLE